MRCAWGWSFRALLQSSCRGRQRGRGSRDGRIQNHVARLFPVTGGVSGPSVESLNLNLLVEAENDSMLRRVEVETDHVSGLLLKVGIVRRHVVLVPVWLDAMLLPDAGNHHMMQLKLRGEPSRAPVCRTIGGVFLVQLRMRASSSGVIAVGTRPSCRE